MARHTAILDIDGTLVDSNYQHAIAWSRALRKMDVTMPIWRIHRHIGMGGDKFVAAIAGEETEREHGDEIREAESDEFRELIEEVVPLDGAKELISDLKERGLTVVLASSAKDWEVDHYLDLLDVREVVDGWTTSADVDATKPEPDLVEVARAKAGGEKATMLGDTTWDVEAALRSGIAMVGVLTGGFGRGELEAAGAVAVFESIHELRRHLDSTPFGAERAAG